MRYEAWVSECDGKTLFVEHPACRWDTRLEALQSLLRDEYRRSDKRVQAIREAIRREELQ